MKKSSADRIADVAVAYCAPTDATEADRAEMRRDLSKKILKVAEAEGL